MSTDATYPHLNFDVDGRPSIGQTRYKVAQLAAEHYQHGWTAEELLRQHGDLRPEQVYAALTYFYDHFDAIVAELKSSLKVVEASRPSTPFSRDVLLNRR